MEKSKMHYGDIEHLEKNILQIVVYKNVDLTQPGAKKIWFRSKENGASPFLLPAIYELISIQKCQLISPNLLFSFLQTAFNETEFSQLMSTCLNEQDYEKRYLITMKENEFGKLNVLQFQKVSVSYPDILLLH